MALYVKCAVDDSEVVGRIFESVREHATLTFARCSLEMGDRVCRAQVYLETEGIAKECLLEWFRHHGARITSSRSYSSDDWVTARTLVDFLNGSEARGCVLIAVGDVSSMARVVGEFGVEKLKLLVVKEQRVVKRYKRMLRAEVELRSSVQNGFNQVVERMKGLEEERQVALRRVRELEDGGCSERAARLLREDNEALKRENKELKQENADLRQERKELKAGMHELQQRLQEEEILAGSLGQKLDAATFDVALFQKEITELKQAVVDKTTMLLAEIEAKDRLVGELVSARNTSYTWEVKYYEAVGRADHWQH